MVDLYRELQLPEQWFHEGDNDYKTKRDILVEIWSSQCSLCIDCIPKMRRIHAGYQNQLQILTLHVDLKKTKPQTSESLQKFLKTQRIQYPVGLCRPEESSSIWDRLAFSHLPHGLILDGETFEVKWSGSLFTHDITKVVKGQYGSPKRSMLEGSMLMTVGSPSSTSIGSSFDDDTTYSIARSGGVCQLPGSRKKKRSPRRFFRKLSIQA